MAEREAVAERPRTALVLSGGGARGAYQAGVLQGLAEIGMIGYGGSPFDIIVGSSAGSINAGMLAAHADDLRAGVERLSRCGATSMPATCFAPTSARSAASAPAGHGTSRSAASLRRVQPKSLLDTAPLGRSCSSASPARIDEHVKSGALDAAAVARHRPLHLERLPVRPGPGRRSRRGSAVAGGSSAGTLTVDHLMASSAIPIFFPSVRIDGRHFGDGCIRNTAPLSPAINLGADRVVAIGVQGPGAAELAARAEAAADRPSPRSPACCSTR